MTDVKQQAIEAYNKLGKSQVVDWEPCQPCPACGLFADGYKRVDGTSFVVCIPCDSSKIHKPDCHYLLALKCPIAISCEEHHLEVCPICDKCNCKELP